MVLVIATEHRRAQRVGQTQVILAAQKLEQRAHILDLGAAQQAAAAVRQRGNARVPERPLQRGHVGAPAQQYDHIAPARGAWSRLVHHLQAAYPGGDLGGQLSALVIVRVLTRAGARLAQHVAQRRLGGSRIAGTAVGLARRLAGRRIRQRQQDEVSVSLDVRALRLVQAVALREDRIEDGHQGRGIAPGDIGAQVGRAHLAC